MAIFESAPPTSDSAYRSIMTRYLVDLLSTQGFTLPISSVSIDKDGYTVAIVYKQEGEGISAHVVGEYDDDPSAELATYPISILWTDRTGKYSLLNIVGPPEPPMPAQPN